MDIKEEINTFKSMVNSYKLTSLIITANNIGIFNILTEDAKSIEQIAKECDISNDRIEPILNGLVFNKIINKNEIGYYLDEYKDVLLNNSKYNQTGYIDFAQTVMEKYNNLEKAIKDNNFALDNFKELTDNQADSFIKGMHSNAMPQAEYIASQYIFENHNILDIGAGTYLITVAKKYESVRGKMIDLPQISKIQNSNIEKENLMNRLVSISCDYNNDFPQEKYDDVFLFAVVHQEPIENVRKLLDNIYNALKPNGRLFLTSFFLNDDKISPEFSVQFAIEMLVNSKEGKVYTHSEINSLLQESKFSQIERIGEVGNTCLALIFTDFNINTISEWSIILLIAFLLMVLYEIYWVRYFKSNKTMKDMYSSILGIPVAGATLPVLSFLLLGIYGKNIPLIVSTIILGIGHIGIHMNHKKEAE